EVRAIRPLHQDEPRIGQSRRGGWVMRGLFAPRLTTTPMLEVERKASPSCTCAIVVNGRSGSVACSTSERAHAERAGFTAAESMWAAALPTAEYITALDVDLRADLGPDSGWRGGIDPLDLDLRHLALIPLGSVNSKKFERLAGARRLRVGKRDAVVQDRAEVFDCYRGRVSRGRGRDSC